MVRRLHLLSMNLLAAGVLAIPGANAQTPDADTLAAALARIDALTSRLAAVEAELAKGQVDRVAVKPAPDAVKVTLKPGPSFSTADGATTFAIDGRVLADAGWVVEDGAADIGDDTDLRALWFGFSGKFGGDWRYRLQTSVDNNNVGVKDAYIAFDGIRNAPIMVGNFYENNGIEIMSGSLNTTFMEGGSGITAFRTLRHLGVTVDPHGDNWGAQIGVFGDGAADAAAGTDDEGWSVASRLTAAPLMTDDYLVHIGGSWRRRVPDAPSDAVRFRSAGESHVIGETLVDTGNIAGVESYTTAALEGMLRFHGLTLMSEYNITDLSRAAGGDPSLTGGYVSLGWLLTGEQREYNAKRGTIGRLKPASPFAIGREGFGAWELAARFNALDLSDGPVSGGEMDSITLGLNWYPNQWSRLMLNYVANDLDATGPVAFRETDPEYLMVRMQADF